MQHLNVVRRVFKLQSCKKVGRVSLALVGCLGTGALTNVCLDPAVCGIITLFLFIPTCPFTILEPQHQEIRELFEVQKRILKLQSCERVGRDLL